MIDIFGRIRAIYDRIGAPAGASIAADVATVKGEADKFQYGAVGSGDINIIFPCVDQPSSAIEFCLAELTDDFIADGEITAVGQIDIYRFRKGTDAGWTAIVTAGTPAGTALGSLNYSFTFPTASWAVGDMAQIHMSGAQVTVNGNVFTIPRKTIYAVVGFSEILQDLEDGGRLDLIIDAIKGDTDLINTTAIDGTTPPVANTLSDTLHKDGSYTYDNTTDSLEAISNKIDAGFALTGDAVVANVLASKTFYKDNYQDKLTGTMPDNAGDVASVSAHMGVGTTLHVVPAAGYTDGSDDATTIDLVTVDGDLITGNIKSGITILGVAGSSTVKDVSDWTDAVEADVASGKKFYKADGSQGTGTHV